jgi:hypothetical protein
VKPKVRVFFMAFLTASLFGASELFSGSSEQIHATNANGLKVPSYLTDVPSGHIAGVSTPSNSLAEARDSAIGDIIRQILGAIGVKYNHHYFDEVSGNVRNPQRVIDDKLSGNAQGTVMDVERSIVKSSWLTEDSGNYVYFALVYYPEEKIQKMRRLSKGAKVIATAVSGYGNYLGLKISEVNGVSVIISSADLRVLQTNKFANVITLFLWKVPPMIEHTTSISVDPIEVCGNSANIQVPINNFGKSLLDYFLGAQFEKIAVLKGYDEIGRTITVKVEF